jgi:hypothetical protein
MISVCALQCSGEVGGTEGERRFKVKAKGGTGENEPSEWNQSLWNESQLTVTLIMLVTSLFILVILSADMTSPLCVRPVPPLFRKFCAMIYEECSRTKICIRTYREAK